MVCFFLKDTPPPEIYTLSRHAALPISKKTTAEKGEKSTAKKAPAKKTAAKKSASGEGSGRQARGGIAQPVTPRDRKSTRLNSSHANISYAVFCLKKNTDHPYASGRREP